MSNQKGFLVFDIGTGNARVAIVGTTGHVFAIEREDAAYEIEPLYPDSRYFSPQKLWAQVVKLAKQAIAKATDVEIAAVTSTSQRQGIILLDQEGTPFIGLPNIDNRGRQWEQAIQNPQDIYKETGRLPTALFSGLKLFAVKQKQPELGGKLDKFTSISDWVTFMLSGKLVYEPSQAAETLLYDVRNNRWSEELCGQFGFSMDLLPPIAWSGEILGTTTPAVEELLGLPASVPVIVGGGDTQLAIKSTHASVDDIVLVSGTTTPIVKIADRFVEDNQSSIWVNSHVEKDRWIAETNPGITGLNYQKLKTIFYPNEGYEVMEKEMSELTDFTCVASLGSYLTDQKNALVKGGFIIDAPISQELTRAHFIWAALREIACAIKLHFDNLTDIVSYHHNYVWACGGGVQSHALIQLLADLLQKEIRIREGYVHSSIIGAAVICNETLGIEEGFNDSITVIKPSVDFQGETIYEEWKQAQNFFKDVTNIYKNNH